MPESNNLRERGSPAERLQAAAQALGCDLSATQQARLLDYLAMMARWNKVYNLTAVRDPDEMLTLHLIDSLAVLPPLRRWLDAQAVRPGERGL